MNILINILPFFIISTSGFCSLFYQVVWERLIRNNFGGDVTSATIVTSTFILGLGIGAYLFKKNWKEPVIIYALTELIIGLYAFFSYDLIVKIPQFFDSMIILNFNASLYKYLLVLFCVLILLPPCIFIGGTLPLIFHSFISKNKYFKNRISFFYGINIIGGSICILSIPFILLNRYPIPNLLVIVGSINILLSFLIMIWKKLTKKTNIINSSEYLENCNKKEHRKYLILSFISGTVCLTMEIIYFRTASVFWPSSSYNFPFILSILLLLLGLGSLIIPGVIRKIRIPSDYMLAWLFVMSGIGIFLSVIIRIGFQETNSYISIFRLYFLMLLPFAFFQGGIFPILLENASFSEISLPYITGRLYLVNSLGAFIAVVLTQFFLIPYFGTSIVIIFIILLSFFTALYIFNIFRKKREIILTLIITFLILITISNLKSSFNRFIFQQWNAEYEGLEGKTGNAVIEWNKEKTEGAVKVNNQYMSYLPDHPKHILLALFPLSFEKRENILILGLGGGGMVREIAKDKMVKKIYVVDWSNELIRILSKDRAHELLNNLFVNPKISIIETDARLFVNKSKQYSFDIVVDNLSLNNWVGSANIKSIQYFYEIKRILKDKGVYILDNINSYDANSVMAGLCRNFRYINLYENSIAMSSNSPIVFDDSSLDKALEQRKEILNASKPYKQWFDEKLFLVDIEKCKELTPIRDEFPSNEYYIKLFNSP